MKTIILTFFLFGSYSVVFAKTGYLDLTPTGDTSQLYSFVVTIGGGGATVRSINAGRNYCKGVSGSTTVTCTNLPGGQKVEVEAYSNRHGVTFYNSGSQEIMYSHEKKTDCHAVNLYNSDGNGYYTLKQTNKNDNHCAFDVSMPSSE